MLNVLLVNPPIHDFTAYDFWLRPYGMFRVAGRLRKLCALSFFDFLQVEKRDPWGRGRFEDRDIPKPAALADIQRRYRRFGKPRADFRLFLVQESFDWVLIQTMMTYWYPGIVEVVEDVRELQPRAKIALGGVYATLCPEHAASLGADLIVEGSQLDPLWQSLGLSPADVLPFWDDTQGGVGVLKLTEGCPFRCSYCSVPLLYPEFRARPTEETVAELKHLVRHGARHVAFYDDALLYRTDEVLGPFLETILKEDITVNFHTPNALNARFITPEMASLMVRAGFCNFFLGLESSRAGWQRATGGKLDPVEFHRAVEALRTAGAESIISYVMIGHPSSEDQQVESTMELAHDLGIRIMLSEFAPVPGTPDGERCRKWVNMEEPLEHNKTSFTIRRLGPKKVAGLKSLCQELNHRPGIPRLP
jgi:radical SAM superfamily enzyme YgiQ (UPF0313 family)